MWRSLRLGQRHVTCKCCPLCCIQAVILSAGSISGEIVEEPLGLNSQLPLDQQIIAKPDSNSHAATKAIVHQKEKQQKRYGDHSKHGQLGVSQGGKPVANLKPSDSQRTSQLSEGSKSGSLEMSQQRQRSSPEAQDMAASNAGEDVALAEEVKTLTVQAKTKHQVLNSCLPRRPNVLRFSP